MTISINTQTAFAVEHKGSWEPACLGQKCLPVVSVLQVKIMFLGYSVFKL